MAKVHWKHVTFSLGVVLASVSGCGPAMRTVTVSVPGLAFGATESTAADAGIQIEVLPITEANLSSVISLLQSHGHSAPIATVEVGGVRHRLLAVPPPAFLVRITNGTGHVVRLENAIFRLDTEPDGGRYRAIETSAELVGWARSYHADTLRHSGVPAAAALDSAIARVPLLTRDTVLLDRDVTMFVAAFDVPVRSLPEYYEFLSAQGRVVRLRFAEIPSAFDGAGVVTQTFGPEFALGVELARQQWTCSVAASSWVIDVGNFHDVSVRRRDELSSCIPTE